MPPSGADDALRPTLLSDFAGQPELADHLGVVLGAARSRQALPDHILLFGPPGLGKTTLAAIIANELRLPLRHISGPTMEKPADITNALMTLNGPTVLFVDEIHRMPRAVEEHLYSAMEDRKLSFTLGQGNSARVTTIEVQPFVLIGATTQSGLLSAPLRDRFGFHGRLRLYDTDALTSIVTRSARLLEEKAAAERLAETVTVTADAAREIASRSRGTPRIANRNLRRVLDVAQVDGIAEVTQPAAAAALERFNVDAIGLDSVGRDILEALTTTFNGGPVGLNTLAAAVDEAPHTLEQQYEPFLMQNGLLARTPRGRMATAAAYAHLGLPAPGPVAATATAEDAA